MYFDSLSTYLCTFMRTFHIHKKNYKILKKSLKKRTTNLKGKVKKIQT